MEIDLSIVLLTWNSEKFIGKCLGSIFQELRMSDLSYEIFIVDNGSKDGTKSIIRSFQNKHFNHLITIYLEFNRGTTYSRNIALRSARGRYVCIMDSDVEIKRGVIEHLIDTLKFDPKIGLIAPKLLNSDGSVQKSTDVFPTVFRKILRYFFLRIIEKRELRSKSPAMMYEVDYAISAFWIVKTEVLQDLGYFDENIFYAPEDVDFCLRVWLSGYKVFYDTRVAAIHHGQEISRGLKLSSATLNHVRGLLYYFRKHRYILRPPIKSNKQKRLYL